MAKSQWSASWAQMRDYTPGLNFEEYGEVGFVTSETLHKLVDIYSRDSRTNTPSAFENCKRND